MAKKYKSNNTALIIGVIAVAMIALLAFGLPQTQLGGQDQTGSDTDITQCPDSSASPTFLAKNEYSKSTTVSVTPYLSINGGPINNRSGDSLPVGAKITGYYSASDYIDQEIESFTVTCGMSEAPVQYMKPTDDPSTFEVKEDASTLSDDATGGSTNASATSGVLDLVLKVGASSDTTTGDLIIVLEYDNDTQADDITLSGGTDASVPEIYTEEASGSLVKAYRISEIEDGSSRSFDVNIEPESGQTLESTALRITRYSVQAFEDTDGSVLEGVEDGDGTAKYEDSGDYDIYVGASA